VTEFLLIAAGFAAGYLISGPFCVNQYKSVLLMCAKQQTAEKMGDEFYYIVPESAFCDMKTAQIIIAQVDAGKLVRLTDVGDLTDVVGKALKKAWQLGQTYWQQADSDYASQHKKSDETQRKFERLVDDTTSAIEKHYGIGPEQEGGYLP